METKAAAPQRQALAAIVEGGKTLEFRVPGRAVACDQRHLTPQFRPRRRSRSRGPEPFNPWSIPLAYRPSAAPGRCEQVTIRAIPGDVWRLEGMKLSSRPASTVKVRASRFSGGALLSAMLRSARSRHGDFVFAGVGPVPRHVQEVQDSVGGVEDEALSEVVVEPTAFDASPGLEGLEAFRPAPLVPFRAALSFPGSPSVVSNGSRGFAVRQPTRRTRREGGRRSCRRAAQAGRGRIERHLVFLAHSLAAEFQRSSGAPAAPPRSPIDLGVLAVLAQRAPMSAGARHEAGARRIARDDSSVAFSVMSSALVPEIDESAKRSWSVDRGASCPPFPDALRFGEIPSGEHPWK